PERKSSDYAPAPEQSPTAAASRPIASSSARPATSSSPPSPAIPQSPACAALPERHTALRKYSDSLPPSDPDRWSVPAESLRSSAAPRSDHAPHRAPPPAPSPP